MSEPIKIKESTPPDYVFKHAEASGEQAAMMESAGFITEPEVDENGKILLDEDGFQIPKKRYPEGGGQKVYLKGCLYPRWGDMFPSAIVGINATKRWLIGQFRLINSLPKLTLLSFVFTTWKQKRKIIRAFLDEWTDFSHKTAWLQKKNYFLDYQYYKPSVMEFIRFLALIFFYLDLYEPHLNGNGEIVATAWQQALDAAECFGVIPEYDDQYDYRRLDFINEIDAARLYRSPISELYRVLKIYNSRERQGLQNKTKVFYILLLVLLLPRVRKAFRQAVKETNFDKMRPDVSDAYFCLRKSDYDYGGRSFEWRFNKWNEVHGGNLPPMVKSIGPAPELTASEQVEAEEPELYPCEDCG